MADILVLFYSRHGATAALAREIARGVEAVDGARALLRTVPALHGEDAAEVPLASAAELADCDGLMLGSPGRFGNMAAPLKAFLEAQLGAWLSGQLRDKPAGVFTATGSPHGGQESTLLSMQLALLHHGMLIVGIPYRETALNHSGGGGSPYGSSHWSGADGARPIDGLSRQLARAHGRRVASLAARLAGAGRG